MKQNSIFSYVKRNNNNSGGADGNAQSSSNVRGMHLLRSRPNVIQSHFYWRHTFEIQVLFAG